MAIAAVDVALWDLKAKLLKVPLVRLLGGAGRRPFMAAADSPAIRSEQLQAQLGGWAAAGISRVKMKIGSEPKHDLARVRGAARGDRPGRSSYLSMPTGPTAASRHWAMAEAFAISRGSFEEPVSVARRIWQVYGSCVRSHRPEWKLPRASMATT